MAYITKAEVTAYLKVTLSPAEEAQIDALIPAVEEFAESYCGRTWNNGTNEIVEAFDGGTDTFLLRNAPIDEIVSITEDGEAIAAEDIYTYKSHIRLAYTVSNYPRSIVITYKANSPLPADLKQAMIQWVAELFKSAPEAGKGVKRFTVGPVTVEYATNNGVPTFFENALNRYRLIPV